MCYVLDFDFLSQLKVCKFSEFPRPFQIINYLFFKEVCKRNVYSILRIKKAAEESATFPIFCSFMGVAPSEKLYHFFTIA